MVSHFCQNHLLGAADRLSGTQYLLLSNEGVGLISVALNPGCSGKITWGDFFQISAWGPSSRVAESHSTM